MRQPPKWVRSGVLSGASELIAKLGGDEEALFARASIPSGALHRPDTPIEVGAVVRLLDDAASNLGSEAFGLRLGQLQDLSLFGPIWSLLESAATVGELLRDLARYFPLHTQGALVAVAPVPDGVMLTYDLASGVAQSHRQVVELGFGVLIAELRRHNPNWRPREVFLRHAPPRDLTWHRRWFGPGLMFNADRNAVCIEEAILRLPRRSADRDRHNKLAARFDQASYLLEGRFRTRAETFVRALLPFSPCELSTIADLMGTSVRTLQRRLAAEATSFEQIIDAVRAELALSYFMDSSLSAAEIAEILQFSQTSALSRAFRRWHGTSARQVRARDGGDLAGLVPE